MKTQTRTFPSGGVHPADDKERTAALPLTVSEPPAAVEVLMLQHIGAPAKPIVERKDEVKKGQCIGEAQGFISAHVHSPVSGAVKNVRRAIHAPTGRMVTSVLIDNDGREEWAEGLNEPQDVEALDAAQMIEMVKDAGVVGMGGATFPTHVKLAPPPDQKVTDVILNGAECEPYLTCDHRLMLERTEDLVDAMKLIMRIVGAPRGHVTIEDNKPDAIEAFAKALADAPEIALCPLQVKYPQGSEQQIIAAVTGREVPSGGLPSHVGCLVHNVATALAVRDAIRFRRPLIDRPMTVTGDGIENPGNIVERVGADVADILERHGVREGANLLISGGPMMGVALGTPNLPVIKGMSGLLCQIAEEVPRQRSCIRCGRCVQGCPLRLVPSDLSIVCESRDWDTAVEFDLMECKECGTCAYVCPAKRRITQLIRFGKSEIAKRRRKKP